MKWKVQTLVIFHGKKRLKAINFFETYEKAKCYANNYKRNSNISDIIDFRFIAIPGRSNE